MSAGGTPRPIRLLHLHASFDPGGKELRAVRLMNAFAREGLVPGATLHHTIVSGVRHATGAARAIAPDVPRTLAADFPSLTGTPTPTRLYRLARAMLGHDLVLSYNFGAMDAVMAHRLYARVLGLPPLIHHEDGFNAEEAQRRYRRRTLYRRLGLARAAAVVVCSHTLARIARAEWRVAPTRLRHIANGIDTAVYTRPPDHSALAGLAKPPGALWLGSLAGLRRVKNLPRLVRAFAAADLPEAWQLVILGEGPEADAIHAEAARLGVAARVHLPGHVRDPATVLGLFDLFALTSDSEQAPISLIEAMAAGLAVVATDVGDVAAMLAPANQAFVAAPDDEAGLARMLRLLAGDAAGRARLGAANRAHARAHYGEASMIAAYHALYAKVLAAGALGHGS